MSDSADEANPHAPEVVLSDRAADRLQEYGTVLVFRAERRQEGATWWRPSRGAAPVDPVRVERLTTVAAQSGALATYVVESGYGSAIGWAGSIRTRTGKAPIEGHLYRVTTLGETSGPEVDAEQEGSA